MPNPTLSDAIQEAYASAPSVPIMLTLEFHHPSFTTPLRVVQGHASFTARLEDSAPVDAGEEVTFTPFAFDFLPPEVSTTNGQPEVTITIDNVSRDIMAYLDQAANSSDLIEVLFRTYLENNPEVPEINPPLRMTIREVDVDVFQITARARFGDSIYRMFPSELYDTARFPGLIAT